MRHLEPYKEYRLPPGVPQDLAPKLVYRLHKSVVKGEIATASFCITGCPRPTRMTLYGLNK
jgi:hypothetical protein